ncbi:hypothetical protein [Magnetospirillum sulfuroxidans]|uniref:Cytochrome c domain-containing protein n=1 Tax=Magnetospirillum sulfuroxidans TaxID=611300 RepID=A0ABS5IDZ1_9PROT|nr:hypothetical protein [Magnetospirillum sulfuroxidans]MBR9972644.1 hypothetical protein [Magnetospirillum sulfuroxidans]
MRVLAFSLLSMLALALPAAAEQPEEIFDRACGTCHFKQRDPARRDEMIAPPMDMMAAHLRQVTGPERAVFVARVLDFIKAPAEAKAVDAMAVQRFGLMPPIGDTFPELTDGQLNAVANWIFDRFATAQVPPQGQQRGRMAP